ncbi:MAG: hypothetical protein RLZZ05_1636, partial [Bacteroidota bacterium]
RINKFDNPVDLVAALAKDLNIKSQL